VLDHWPNQILVGRRVLSQVLGRCLHRPLQDDGRAVVQRMGQRGRGVNPLQAVLDKGQSPQEWRGYGSGYTQQDIVLESGQGQLGGANASPHRRPGLEDGDGKPAWASFTAAARPLGPEPTTTASYERESSTETKSFLEYPH